MAMMGHPRSLEQLNVAREREIKVAIAVGLDRAVVLGVIRPFVVRAWAAIGRAGRAGVAERMRAIGVPAARIVSVVSSAELSRLRALARMWMEQLEPDGDRDLLGPMLACLTEKLQEEGVALCINDGRAARELPDALGARAQCRVSERRGHQTGHSAAWHTGPTGRIERGLIRRERRSRYGRVEPRSGSIHALPGSGSSEEQREGVGHRGRLVDRGAGQQRVLSTADDRGGRREDASDALAVAARADVDVRNLSVDRELRAALECPGCGALGGREVEVPAARAALRLDLRDGARVDARPDEELLDDGDGVGAVGVDDHEPRGSSGARSGADAHGVPVPEAEPVLRQQLPAGGEAHLLLAVDEVAREREERDAMGAVTALGLGEHAGGHLGFLKSSGN